MMDKELPAKIWVPALAACALIPFALFKPHAVSAIINLGVLGFGAYFAVKAIRAKQGRLALGYVLGALLVIGVINQATAPPPTPEELATRAAQAQAKEAKAAREAYLMKKKDTTTAECKELFGDNSDMCKPIMSAEAWREFQGAAAQSHEHAQAAHAYSDGLHDYVETYHHLPPDHVVIDPK
jgi:hypothetical protein